MKKVWKSILAIVLGILVNGAIILAFVLWCKHIDKTTPQTSESLTSSIEVTVTVPPTSSVNEEVYTVTPAITEEAMQMPENEPTKMPEVTEEPELSQALAITSTPTSAPVQTVEPQPTKIPEATATPTATPTIMPTPTVTPTPVAQRKYVKEYKMGDNVWYRLTEDGTLYVMGTGATWGYDMYEDEDGYLRGDYSAFDVLRTMDGVKHIVIEEGITKLGAWSLMWLPDVESITFPKSLQEIENNCFDGTGRTVNTVWIGLDKDKVKLSDKAFEGTVYQTAEDIRKQQPTIIPTATPTPVLIPMEAESFYQALVEEAGIKINKNDAEPYVAALISNRILSATDIADAGETLSNQEAAYFLYKAARALGVQGDSEVITAAKKYDRISDKSGIVPGYEEAVYFCFGSGIMPGFSDGEYSHTRSFKPKDSIGSEEGRLYCKRLFHQENRIPMSPDAQVIRTTNLPVQAKLYPYILESFPNIYYDANYLYMYNVETDDRAYPDVPDDVGFLESWCTANTIEAFSESQPERCRIFTSETNYLGFEKVGMDKVVERYRDTWEQQAKEYLELVFDFDYRTVRSDTEWQEKIKNLNAYYHENGKGAREGSCAGKRGIDEWFSDFLDNAEQYHTIVECSEIDFDMSTLFYSERFHDSAPYTIRVHLRYRITTDYDDSFSELAEVIPVCSYDTVSNFTSFGEWKDVYAELTFATNSFDRTGISGVRVLEYNTDDAIRYHFDPKQYVKKI